MARRNCINFSFKN